MSFPEPGERPADGVCAPSRPLYVSGLTRVYLHVESGQYRLDQALVTEHRECADFADLRRYVLEDIRYPEPQSHKHATHSWAPTLYMPGINVARGHHHEDCWRCGEAEADDLSCWVADLDNKNDGRPHVTEAEVAPGMASLLPGQRPVEHFTYTTFSSSAEHRKFRLVCETDRNLTRAEMLDIFVLANERAFGGQGDGSIYDPGDHVYGPPYNTETTVTHGAPLHVDAVLAAARELKAAQPDLWAPFQKQAKQAKPVRAATPEELANMHARIANRSAIAEFVGIDDPAVFNPAWRNDYPMTVVQGSHYHTMLSLLGRVWRKTGGRLSYGEMLEVFDQIDALDGFYMARNYPREKPREMLRFVMSQPVTDDARPNADALEWRMRRFKTTFFNKKV